MSWLRGVAIAAFVTAAVACSSISTVRVQPENVHVGKGLRPIAVVHAQVTSFELLFFEIPGHVTLDYVVNRMLIHAAKQMGADKVVDIKVDITPDDGIWVLRRLFGWRSAQASGVAVVVEDEAAPAPAPAPAAPAPASPSPPAAPAPAPSK
ncbi:MAG TPA: hypothetical protein VIV11_28145 [Kofleriaceae bacterium]